MIFSDFVSRSDLSCAKPPCFLLLFAVTHFSFCSLCAILDSRGLVLIVHGFLVISLQPFLLCLPRLSVLPKKENVHPIDEYISFKNDNNKKANSAHATLRQIHTHIPDRNNESTSYTKALFEAYYNEKGKRRTNNLFNLDSRLHNIRFVDNKDHWQGHQLHREHEIDLCQ